MKGFLLADDYFDPFGTRNLEVPAWFGGHISAMPSVTGVPVDLVQEIDIEHLTTVTVEHLSRSGKEANSDDGGRTLLDASGDGGFRFVPGLQQRVDHLVDTASLWFGRLLEEAPLLELDVQPPTTWLSGPPIQWLALDPTGARVPLGQLSRAQIRWASFAIQIALQERSPLPMLVLLDEPEAALHRRAERHLVDGLEQLADELGATVVVATHSPAFLRQDQARLVHVHRAPDGTVQAEPMEPDLRTRAQQLGLDMPDLLQFCRRALLVEGEHEVIIFDELFRDEFARHGVEVMALRGATQLKNASDAQLLFRFTNADLLVLLDNEDSTRITDIWERACAAVDNGQEPYEILKDFRKGGWKAEASFLEEYCALALRLSGRDRIALTALHLPDIIDYLPAAVIAPKAVKHGDWPELRERHAKSGTKKQFKPWMSLTYDARYDEETVRVAVRQLDHIPEDFTAVLARATARTDSARTERR